MFKHFLICLCLLNISFLSIGQTADPIELDEVLIEGIPIEKYSAGSKITTMDSLTKSTYKGTTLTDILQQKTAIYVREYGNGMLSTLSLRGTTSSQTAVIWNGLNINSFSLGNLDLSLIPVYAVDQVEIQHGSASSLYGSDAIGGSIHLSNVRDWKKKLSIGVQQDIGSFNQFFTGGGIQYGNGKLDVSTRFYRKVADNDFQFRNITMIGQPEQRQQNAAFKYHGIMQELAYRITDQQVITFNGWFNNNFREIQPNMPGNLSSNNYEIIEDRNLRMVTNYRNDSKIGFFDFKLGWIDDYQNFNDLSRIAISRIVSGVQWEKDLFPNLMVKAGSEINHISTAIESYEDQVQENRYDWFLSFNYQPLARWKTTLNMRQTLISNYEAPLTPSLGTEFKLLDKSNKTLKIKALASKGYRIPTLNDRFWPQSGNPNLQPETSHSMETGFVFDYIGNINWCLESTAFMMQVDDMIVWIPGGALWSPKNVQEVLIKGLEVSTKFSSGLGQWQWDGGINYTFNASINQNGFTESSNSTTGKQMPYTPRHNGNIYLNNNFRKWQATLEAYYVGERFESLDNKTTIAPYLIQNFSISRPVTINKIDCSFTIKINNLFDVEYQNLLHRAMPGRNYQASLRFHFSKFN